MLVDAGDDPGRAELFAFLASTRVLISFLPLTRETRNLLDRATLSQLPRGAWLVNVARGPIVVEEDLLALLDEGHLAGATLDVFREEPLPPGHPFWHHPRITLTPHTSAVTLANIAGAALDVNAGETIGTLSGGGTAGGNITLNANTLTVNQAINATYTGIVSGAGGIDKQGAGMLTLSGANTYTGATAVNTGTLRVGAANRIADASAVTVASGAIFDLNTFADLQKLPGLLEKRGYKTADIEAIMHGNWLRFFGEVLPA